MVDIDTIWQRISSRAGEQFHTKRGLPFTYVVPGAYLRVTRDGREINRSLSKTNFREAAEVMPVDGPGDLKDRQGSAYTWAILMDARIRRTDW